MKERVKSFLPVLLVFVVLNSFFFSGRLILQRWGADQEVLIWGNLILFAVTAASFFLARRGMKNPNPYAFVRAVYASIMIKLFICMIAAFVYISTNKAQLNKPALFTCMALYLVYTFLEVASLMKMLRKGKNG
jgi:hypothetical protein